jgi:hypothetical protein
MEERGKREVVRDRRNEIIPLHVTPYIERNPMQESELPFTEPVASTSRVSVLVHSIERVGSHLSSLNSHLSSNRQFSLFLTNHNLN